LRQKCETKAAVLVSGDAYLKFDRLMQFNRGIGFEFDNFKPQPIFELIQKTSTKVRGVISDEEMFKTFNMGWGFAVVIDYSQIDEAIDLLEKNGVESEKIGMVTDSGKNIVKHKGKKIVL